MSGFCRRQSSRAWHRRGTSALTARLSRLGYLSRLVVGLDRLGLIVHQARDVWSVGRCCWFLRARTVALYAMPILDNKKI